MMVACNSSPKEATPTAASTTTAVDPMEAIISQNVALVETYFEHFNNHDWEQMANMYASAPEFKDPSMGPDVVVQTQEEIIAKYSELEGIFSDVKDEVKAIYPSGKNNVIVEFVSTGIDPGGEGFVLPICTIFEIKDGKITKDYTYYDNF